MGFDLGTSVAPALTHEERRLAVAEERIALLEDALRGWQSIRVAHTHDCELRRHQAAVDCTCGLYEARALTDRVLAD